MKLVCFINANKEENNNNISEQENKHEIISIIQSFTTLKVTHSTKKGYYFGNTKTLRQFYLKCIHCINFQLFLILVRSFDIISLLQHFIEFYAIQVALSLKLLFSVYYAYYNQNHGYTVQSYTSSFTEFNSKRS